MQDFKVGDVTVTRNGLSARIICIDLLTENHTIIALVKSSEVTEFIWCTQPNGQRFRNEEHGYDLMINKGN